MLLTFEECRDVWLASGHINNRGSAYGKFVLSREDGFADYVLGRCFIEHGPDNAARAKLGRPVKQCTRDKMSAQRVGVPKSKESNDLRSSAMAAMPKTSCVHCGGCFTPQALGRYHGDKCKHKGQLSLFGVAV